MSHPKIRFALRADVKDGFRPKLDVFLGKCATGFIVAYETADGENPHIHAIFDAEKSLKAVRNLFVRTCDDHKGQKDYSLKVCDDNWEAYIRYICKGINKDSPPVIWTRQGLDYTPEVISAAHKAYYVNQDSVDQDNKKKRKLDGGSVIHQIEAICKEKGYKSYQREDIAGVYLDMFRDARKGINVFAARAVVNTVCLLLDDPDCQRRALASKIADM